MKLYFTRSGPFDNSVIFQLRPKNVHKEINFKFDKAWYTYQVILAQVYLSAI